MPSNDLRSYAPGSSTEEEIKEIEDFRLPSSSFSAKPPLPPSAYSQEEEKEKSIGRVDNKANIISLSSTNNNNT